MDGITDTPPGGVRFDVAMDSFRGAAPTREPGVRMVESDTVDQIYPALCKLQRGLHNPRKNKVAQVTGETRSGKAISYAYRYADAGVSLPRFGGRFVGLWATRPRAFPASRLRRLLATDIPGQSAA